MIFFRISFVFVDKLTNKDGYAIKTANARNTEVYYAGCCRKTE